MPNPQEICVFFPCHTLEDFPTHLRDDAAAGILTAWTSPWHPRILARIEQIPTWNRADTPPIELKNRLLLIPSAAEGRLPSDLNGRLADTPDCRRISVTNRPETTSKILEYLEIPANLATESDVYRDFYALGYAALQVQIMTRRLRYSSNLDLATFTEHVIMAAKAFCANDETATRESLHAAFDLLAEERDHYFSSDPHLIELVLLAESTLGRELGSLLDSSQPVNLLISADLAEKIACEHPDVAKKIRDAHAAGTVGLVGGSPNDSDRLDSLGSSSVAAWLRDSLDRTEAALGVRPVVFGRLGGGIPGDLPPWLISAGFRGAVTNDFSSGVGWQEESKLIWQSGGAEIESLTAKPQEITQPQTFLGIGPRLGEAADSGQVAAALLVRWPGQDCPFMDDLRRASGYSLALGRFWTLDRFFTHGERPFHSCTLTSVAGDGAGLERRVQENQADPLSRPAANFLTHTETEATNFLEAFTTLVETESSDPSVVATTSSERTVHSAAQRLAQALGFLPAKNNVDSSAIAVLNPHAGAARMSAQWSGPPPAADTPGLFGTSGSKSKTHLTIDIPSHGFATAVGSGSAGHKSTTSAGLFKFFSKPKPLARANSLSNEFLDVAVHPETGAVAAVHAGQQRGNRFSWQLAYYDADHPSDTSGNRYSSMHCKTIKIIEADPARGTVEVTGELRLVDKTIGRFINRYSVIRGSRWLEIEVQIENLEPQLGDSPWKNYVAGRATWATDAISVRPLVRDKRHRTSGKRLEAPLGVLVDEGDRKLQVCGYGLPAHRRIGSKELDTLLLVKGESNQTFRLAYGFDVPAPVRSARQHLVPPLIVRLESLTSLATRSWLFDVDSPSVVVSDYRALDKNTLQVVVVETSGKPVRTRLSLFRDIESAQRVHNQEPLTIENSAAIIRLAGHEVATIEIKLNPT